MKGGSPRAKIVISNKQLRLPNRYYYQRAFSDGQLSKIGGGEYLYEQPRVTPNFDPPSLITTSSLAVGVALVAQLLVG